MKAIVSILIVVSVIALISIHSKTFSMSISLSAEGLDNYLSALGQYQALFAGTIATCAAYFGLLRVKASEDANRERIKQDRFSEWKTILQIRFAEVEKKDPFMIREIIRIRRKLFEDLFDLNFSIQSQRQLSIVFNASVKDLVRFFEEQNNKHIGMGGVYPNQTYSYSFDSFRFLFMGMMDDYYDSLISDLQAMYLRSMDPNRMVNGQMYQAALANYRPT